MAISVGISQNAEDITVLWPSYSTPGNTLTEVRILPYRYSHVHAHCCGVHDSREVKSAFLSISSRMGNGKCSIYRHAGILISYKEKWNHVIFKTMGVSGKCNIKWSDSGAERIKPHAVTRMGTPACNAYMCINKWVLMWVKLKELGGKPTEGIKRCWERTKGGQRPWDMK